MGVALLDRRGEPPHEFALARGPRQRGALATASGHARVERRAGTLQGALDRRFARLEHLGDFGGAKAEDLAQHERGALAGRQVLQRGRECQPHGLSGFVARRRPSGGIGDPFEQHVRVWVEPRRLGHPGRLGRLGHRRYLLWAALAVAERVQAAIGGDPVQPGAERGALLEAASSPRQAASSVSCTMSSASCSDPRIR